MRLLLSLLAGTLLTYAFKVALRATGAAGGKRDSCCQNDKGRTTPHTVRDPEHAYLRVLSAEAKRIRLHAPVIRPIGATLRGRYIHRCLGQVNRMQQVLSPVSVSPTLPCGARLPWRATLRTCRAYLTPGPIALTLADMGRTSARGRTNAVRAARQAAGLTQAELAAAAGVARQTVVTVEAGDYAPSVYLALALATHLGTTVEALFAEQYERVTTSTGGTP